jgi:hypothetical protein
MEIRVERNSNSDPRTRGRKLNTKIQSMIPAAQIKQVSCKGGFRSSGAK